MWSIGKSHTKCTLTSHRCLFPAMTSAVLQTSTIISALEARMPCFLGVNAMQTLPHQHGQSKSGASKLSRSGVTGLPVAIMGQQSCRAPGAALAAMEACARTHTTIPWAIVVLRSTSKYWWWHVHGRLLSCQCRVQAAGPAERRIP